jgi:murein DD-endopeptidase MepM/ murein hydrolase activator NlpD
MSGTIHNCDMAVGFSLNNIIIIHNVKHIPAFGLYQNQWDTLNLSSKKMEIPFFENHLKIILVQDDNSPFAFPVLGTVSTNFIKYKGKQHTGVDFVVQKKEPVVACFDGVVRIVKKYEDYGNTVVVRHYNGLETVYALLDQVCVVTAQQVKAGDVVGYVGISYPNKKNALHFETRFFNEIFNPEKVINFSDRKLQSNMLTLSPNDFIAVPLVKPISPIKQNDEKYESHSSQQPLVAVPTYHIVQKGETVLRICAKYNITEQQLKSLNNIKNDHIEIDQKLRIK